VKCYGTSQIWIAFTHPGQALVTGPRAEIITDERAPNVPFALRRWTSRRQTGCVLGRARTCATGGQTSMASETLTEPSYIPPATRNGKRRCARASRTPRHACVEDPGGRQTAISAGEEETWTDANS
jgi:hypothetical protein